MKELSEGGWLHWLVSVLGFCVSSLMGFKWKPHWLNSCHTEPQTDTQVQSKPAPISTASQHLNQRIITASWPLYTSWMVLIPPVNGIPCICKARKWKESSQRKKRDNLISHSPPETFSLRTQLPDTKRLLSEVNGVPLRSRGKTTGNLHVFSHTHYKDMSTPKAMLTPKLIKQTCFTSYALYYLIILFW